MANKKNSKYEKPGGMKKGRIGVGIFIVAGREIGRASCRERV